jgi:hypothetical protein
MECIMKAWMFMLLAVSLPCGAEGSLPATSADCSVITKQNPNNPYAPLFEKICQDSDTRTRQAIAHIYGRPQPSTAIVALPAYGSDAAKRLGFACISGTAMRRLPNGWDQLRDDQHRFLRCQSE